MTQCLAPKSAKYVAFNTYRLYSIAHYVEVGTDRMDDINRTPQVAPLAAIQLSLHSFSLPTYRTVSPILASLCHSNFLLMLVCIFKTHVCWQLSCWGTVLEPQANGVYPTGAVLCFALYKAEPKVVILPLW
jgi:hypothetical protein